MMSQESPNHAPESCVDVAAAQPSRGLPTSPSSAPALTVLILTLNEEALIERAIRSVDWAEQIVVLDAQSGDATVAKARASGAEVHSQPWLGWVAQKERGAALARHDWILSIDADEIVTPELARSIRSALASGPDPRDGFVVRRKNEFLGEIMPPAKKRAKRDTFVRLFNKRCGGWRSDLIVHEEVHCPGHLHILAGDLLHWRNYTIAEQLATLQRNAALEATLISRRSPRNLLYGMTVRPVLRFAWAYVWCGFWRKGRRGYVAASMQAFSEFLRHAQAWEKHVPRRPDPPQSIYRAGKD